MLRQKTNILVLLLINLFFLEYALVFYDFWQLADTLEKLLLASVPLCAIACRNVEWKLRGQLLVINLLFLVLWLTGIVSSYSSKQRATLIFIGWLCLVIGIVVQLRYSWKDLLYVKLYDYIGLIVICLLFVLLSMETIREVPIFDGGLYYAWSIHRQADNFDFSIMSIAKGSQFANHMSIGYGLFVLMGELLSSAPPHNIAGVHLINIMLAVLSIVAFHNLLTDLFPGEYSIKIARTLATAIYAFSPNIFGMVGTVNVDVPGIYFLVIMLFCYVKGYWLLELFFSWGFICTKEPNAIYYAFFLGGILLYEFLYTEHGKKRMWTEVIPRAVLLCWWFIYFHQSAMVSWVTIEQDSAHKFGFSLDNLLGKLQQIFLMNFNWIFLLILIGATIIRFISKKQFLPRKALLPLCMMLIGVLSFNIFYVDFPHPRYIAIGAEIVLLIGSMILMKVISGKTQYICMIVLLMLSTVQSYISVDPLTNRMFPQINLSVDSPTKLVSTSAKFDDGSVYNREYSYYYKALSKTLEAAEYDQNSAIVLPYFCTISNGYVEEVSEIIFYNIEEHKLQVGATYNSIPLVIVQSLDRMSDYEKIIYVVPFYMSEDLNILENMEVENMYETNYRTISVKSYVGYPRNKE